MEICQRILFLLVFVRGLDCLYEEEGPSFIEEPPSRIEFINELGIRLNCSAKGRPDPNPRWTWSDGATLPEVPGLRYFSSSDGSLVFPPFPAEAFRPDVHSSTYRCVVSNSVGTIVSRDVQVRAVVKEQFEARVENSHGTSGFPHVLDCIINPNYMRDYVLVTSWVRDKTFNILPASHDFESSKYHILRDGRLLIWQLTGQDASSTYQCRVLHKLTGQTIVSSPGRIEIRDLDSASPPVIQFRPSTPTVIVKENDPIVLPCVAVGLPKPFYSWFKKEGNRLIPVIDDSFSSDGGLGKNRSPWDSSSGSSTINNGGLATTTSSSGGLIKTRHGALVISSVKVAHKGIYLCNSSNSEGRDYMEVELIVRAPLTVNLNPGDVMTADLGKSAELSCSASGEPQPGQITWMKDGQIFRSGSGAGRIRLQNQNTHKLVITGVTREDQGVYQCVARNDYEAVQKAVQLRLGDAYPQLIYRFIEQTLQPGPSISLKCSATGNPTPKVSWLLDGFPLPQSDRFLIGQYATLHGDVISHVNITSVKVEDGGEYECTFTNRAGKASHAARLNIYGSPHIRLMPEILGIAGQRQTIKCPVGGYPVDLISWERDGMRLPTSDRQSVSSNGTLIIEPVDRSDAGSYACLAENKQGSTSQRSVTVRVMVPPKITPFYFPTDLHEGERASIQCVVAKGDLPLTISWLKDTQPLTNHNGHHSTQHTNSQQHNKVKVSIRQLDHYSSVLGISSLEAIHSGNYSCIVTNNADTAMHTAVLRVNAPPRISPFSFDNGLLEGMRTQVMCTSVAGDEPIRMTWLKDSVQIRRESEDGIHVSHFPPFSTILTIPNITAAHSGNFTCRVSNDVAETSHTAQLSVTVPAKWVVEPKDRSVSVGSHVTINCHATGFPKPTIKWKQALGGPDKKEFREVGYRTPGVLAAENGSLIISRVTEDHEGHYVCVTENGVGSGLSKLIRLTVNAPPSIRSRPQKEMVRKGETVRLRCEAEGDEPIRISWVVKGVSINDTKDSRFATVRHPKSSAGGLSISELTIRDISTEDKGDFECIAVNDFGQDSFKISVLVQERPKVPQNFRIVEHTSRTAVFSWSQPASSSNQDDVSVLDYMLWYKEASENWSDQSNKKSTSGDKTTIVVTGLSPAVTYDFRLFARNQLGMSDPTEVLQVTTDGEPPGGPPLHISVEAISSSEIRVSWQPPAKEYRHGQILGFNLGLKKARDESESYKWNKIPSSPQQESTASTNLPGLEKYTEYELVISSFNEQGEGPKTQPFLVTTLEDVPSAPPTEVICTSATAHSISVNWQPPPKKQSNGNVLSYRISLEQVVEENPNIVEFREISPLFDPTGMMGSPTELESRVTSPSTAFHGLSPYTNYSIQVAAATSVGDGVESQSIYCRTLETVPGPPSNLKVVTSSPSSFIVSWLPPRNPNGRVTKYHLYMRLVQSEREIRTMKRSVPSSVTSYEVTGVTTTSSSGGTTREDDRDEETKTYEIWIAAETGVGEGGQSSVVKFTEGSSSSSRGGKMAKKGGGGLPAAIVSFGRWVAVPWKSEVHLPCQVVGVPKPIVTWKKKETKVIDPNGTDKYEIMGKDNTLKIKSVMVTDSGNYSCSVRNPSGSDHIIYTLLIQVPPTAPLLHPTLVTSSSVRLQWKQGDNGGSPIRGFTLNFRPLDGEWEEITLSKKLSTFQVQNLKCGQVYEFFLLAFNKIGSGDQSKPVKVTTKGSRPLVPSSSSSSMDFIEPYATSIRINLNPWNAPDCPVTAFIIEYKIKSSSSSWNSLRHEVLGTAPQGVSSGLDNTKVVEINELTPETEYIIRIRGVNGAGSSTAEYEISTLPFKGGLRSGSGSPSSSSSSSSSSSDQGRGGGGEGGNKDSTSIPFYQDLYVLLPLILSIFALGSLLATGFLWFRKKKISEGIMLSSTNSLAYRRDPFGGRILTGGMGMGGGGGGGLGDYMSDRDYTVIRAKLMPESDYIPENASDIHPYATFHLPLVEKENSMGENIRDGYLGALPSSQRLSNAEIIPIRQLPRGMSVPNQPHEQQYPRPHHHQRRTKSVSRSGIHGESEAGESDEYDDSCGSDSESRALGMNDNGGRHGTLYGRNNRGNLFRNNDETLLVSDRKSLPRGPRSKFVYGEYASPVNQYHSSSNNPSRVGVYGGGGGTIDRRNSDSNSSKEHSSSATTSFIYNPPPPPQDMMEVELNQIQLPVECDNQISTNNGGRNTMLVGPGRFMTSTPTKLPNANNMKHHPANSKQQQSTNPQQNLPRSDYTIAV